MLNFDFLEKGLGLVFPPHFTYDFSGKSFSCYIQLTHQILLYDYQYFLRYWLIIFMVIASESGCDVINFEIIFFY